MILHHKRFGTHLNSKGETIDKELGLRNSEYVGSTHAEIWFSLVINGHPIVAEYTSEEPEVEPPKISEEWKWVHVRQSRYFLQIVKCKNIECCLSFQLGLQLILKGMFLPPPILVIQTSEGIHWAQNDAGGASYLSLYRNLTMKDALAPASFRRKYPKRVPYGYSNPAVEENVMKKRTCAYCQLYFAAT